MSHPNVKRPEPDEYAGGFGKYIELVPEGDIQQFLQSQLNDLIALLRDVSDAEALKHHRPYTWSIKQVVGHVTDCERVFGYRALRLARGDATPLPSFDENAYMNAANFNRWPLDELVNGFDLLRRSHLQMIRQFEAEAWVRRGIASGQPMSTRATVYAIGGHAKHHIDIVGKRLGRT